MLIIFGGAVNFSSCFAQGIQRAQDDIRKVKTQPASVSKDSVLAHNYNYLAEAFSHSDSELANQYIDTLRRLKEKSLWNKTEGLYFRAVGKYYDRRGDFEDALENYSLAIESLEQAGDQSEYIVYASIIKAFVLNNNGLPDACEEELNKIRPLAESLRNKNYLAWIIDAFGDHYFYSGFGKQDIPRALTYYQEVEAFISDVTNPMIIADNAHGLAGCYLRLGDEEKALQYRDAAIKLAEEKNVPSVIFAVYGDLADVFEEQGLFDEAIEHRQLSLDYAQKAKWIEMEARGESNIANTYKNAGDYQNALFHFERLKAIEDSLSRYDVQVQYEVLEQKYEAGRKDLQIQKLQSDKLSLIRNVLFALLAAMIAFGLYYVYVNRKLVRQNEELHKRNRQIQTALVEGQNIERKRMAIELHDNVNAKIAATKWMVETLHDEYQSKLNQGLITKIIDSIDDIYEDVRFISQNLVPKNIEQKTLPVLIKQLISNLNQVQKVRFDFTQNGTPYKVLEFVKIQCYSVIMELMSNVVKHSGGQQAEISLDFLPETIRIKLKDDGKGFDPEFQYRGAGLNNVRTRIQEVQGTIEFISDKGAGTHVLIEIPRQFQDQDLTVGKKVP
jgi:signal transduction histidine kinase